MLSPVPSEKVSRHFRTFWRIRTSSKTFRGTLPYFSSIPPGRDTLILWSRWVRGASLRKSVESKKELIKA